MDMQELQFYSMLVKCRLLARQSRAGNLNIKRIIANLLLWFNSRIMFCKLKYSFITNCHRILFYTLLFVSSPYFFYLYYLGF